MPRKAVVLLSGGLDSTLAVKLMLDQGVEVVALNFITPFCNCTAKSASCRSEAVRVAEKFGIPVRVVHKGMDYLRIVENPRHGYGRGLNPCIDCRIFMHKAAKSLMEEEGASFLVTGEVLGQRPMSQRRPALKIIERESGTADLIVRPLSAGRFEPSLPEREGWVDRERLLAIEGRSRREQIDLADRLGIVDYPCPAGGCLLTDPEFAGRLKDLFDHKPDYELADVRLLRVGRHFRLHPNLKVVLGRNQRENETLGRRNLSGETVFELDGIPGPTAQTRESPSREDLLKIGSLLLRYAGVSEGTVKAVKGPDTSSVFVSGPAVESEIEKFRIAPFRKGGKRE
jgi:tRNA-specific 2-thiouridylase